MKVALVTGASSGIGRCVALALARADYAVVFAGRREQQLREAAREGGARCLPVVADVTDESSVAALFACVTAQFGRLDLLFNNAGVNAPPTPLEDLTAARWREVLDTNITGAFLCTRAAFRVMKAQQPRGGRIINNGSISAHAPRPRSVGYTVTKHAITGLTKSISLDGRPYNIACGQIDIGNANTEMTQWIAAGAPQADGSVKQEPTFDPQHAADAVVFMAGLPLDANVQFLTITATTMPFVGRG